MKKIIFLSFMLIFLSSCGIKIWDWEVKIDGGENWKIDIGHGKVNLEWKWIGKVDIWGGKVDINIDDNIDKNLKNLDNMLPGKNKIQEWRDQLIQWVDELKQGFKEIDKGFDEIKKSTKDIEK